MEYDARKAMTGSTDLCGQVSVVTGGGRGLGRAFAQALAGAGSVIAVVARSAAEIAETVALIERAGGQARAFTAGDLRDRSAPRRIEGGLIVGEEGIVSSLVGP
jgi:NAD(P)-dependent dehydrogenase (short-subunit alcohol dehydrogenase family)